MNPTMTRDSTTGRKNTLWYRREPRRSRSSKTAKNMPRGVAMKASHASQMTLCRKAGQNSV